jgi:fermentation-respiration switch protein FrsA (DUF1100 family)
MVVIAVLGLLLAAVFWGLPQFFYFYAIGRKNPLPGTPAFQKIAGKRAQAEPSPWLLTRPFEKAGITSWDGLRLNGYFLPARGTSLTVIVAHGYSGDAFQMDSFARFIYERLDCNILLPDARGHGASEGSYTGFGWHERLDYLQWIDWVKERSGPGEAPPRIALYGISMGAATVLMTGGETLPPEVKAIVEDCGYTSAEEELWYQLINRYHIKSRWLMAATSRITQKRAGYSFAEASALEQTRKIKIPVLFIHGGADTFVPTAMVYSLYEACAAPKELYIVPDAGHGGARATAGPEYDDRVVMFLKRWLSRGDDLGKPQPGAFRPEA